MRTRTRRPRPERRRHNDDRTSILDEDQESDTGHGSSSRFHPVDLIACEAPGCSMPAELDDLLEDDDGPIPYLLCDEHTLAWLRQPRV